MSQSLPPSPLRSPLSRASYKPLALEKSFRLLEKDEGHHSHGGGAIDEAGEAEENSSGDASDDSFNSALGRPSSVPRTSSVPGSPTSASGSVPGDSSSDTGNSGSDTGEGGGDSGDEGSDAGEQEHGDRLSELNSPSTPKHPSTSGHTHSTTPKHPFAGATKIEVLHDRGVIDVEEEVRAYAALRRVSGRSSSVEWGRELTELPLLMIVDF